MNKRISALLMCGALSLSMATTAFAAGDISISGGTEDSGQIKVTIQGEAGDSFQGAITVNDKPIVLVDQEFDDNGKITVDVKLDETLDVNDKITVGGWSGDNQVSESTTVKEEKEEEPPEVVVPPQDNNNTNTTPTYRPSYPSNSDSDSGSYSEPVIPTGGISFPSSVLHGSIKTSATRATAGQKVIIVAAPQTGYKLDSLTVTDYYGNTVEVTPVSGDRYSFIMPETSVTIDAVFVLGSTNQNTTVTPTTGLPYSDVALNDWYLNAVQYMYRNGIMTGTSTTTFSPAQTVDRASVVTMLHRLEGSPVSGAATFPDVAAGQWYTAAVAWAASNNVVTGNETGNFAPANTITRQDLAVILYRYAQLKGYSVDATTSLSGYTDAGQISDYAQEAMQWANAAGLITGTTTTTLNPQGSASRAEVATILMRFCMNVAYR